jgi:DNA-binding response OmpR family regulator
MADIKILVVDDDLQMRELLQDFFSFVGYQVESAANGIEALSLVEKGGYNLIITDYEMPVLNGVEFVKKVREKWTSLPVLAASSSDVEVLFLEAGADLFIRKPFDLKGLGKKIGAVIAKLQSI